MVKVLLQQAADQTFYFLKGIIISVYLILPFLIKKNPDNDHQYKKMAVPPGVEPRLNEPKSLVLPLHHGTKTGSFLEKKLVETMRLELTTSTMRMSRSTR